MLKGLGGLGDMAKMMKQAQDMQGKMAQMQDDMENIMVTGVSGAGLVKATATAKGELKALDIDPSIFNGRRQGSGRRPDSGRDQGCPAKSRRAVAIRDAENGRRNGLACGYDLAVLMAGGTDDLDTLIALMGKLPGFGPRSARRAVLHLIKKRSLVLIPLAETMQRVGATARECLNCGNIGTTDICDICTSDKRAIGQICVVEDVADLWAMERSGVFKGRYHVLGGTLSALDAVGPETLRIPKLLDRITAENIHESHSGAWCDHRRADHSTLYCGPIARHFRHISGTGCAGWRRA